MESNKLDRIERKIAKSKKLLEAARILFENNFFEDAISRAYYSMFHMAKSALLLKEIEPEKHAGVIAMFALHFVKTGLVDKLYSDMLAFAKKEREKSDYEEYREMVRFEAEEVVKNASKFIREIEKTTRKLL